MNALRTGGWRIALPFLLPNFIGFVVFLLGPLVGSLLLSFCSWDLLTPPVWIGVGNFRDVIGFHHAAGGWSANDPAFWHYLWNTLVLLLNLPASMAGSLALALMLRHRARGVRFYRLVFYLPSIVSGVAIFYLWRWMFNPDEGLINTLLAGMGIPGPAWLSDPAWSKPAILLMTFWITVGGGGMILYLAALQGVSRELEDAAAIDGAGRWQTFCAVTWPAIRPVTFFIATTGLIHGLQSGGEIAYVMTGGGPAGSTTTLGFYVFQKAYQQFEVGYGAAIAWIIFILVFGVTMLQWRRQAGADAV
jgi:multiple sugar transport system permease protein